MQARPDITAVVPQSALRILDVGCSNGTLGESLRSLTPGRSVHGIELDPVFFEQAKAKLDRVIQADLNLYSWTADYPPAYFDCIIFADVLEHLNNPWHVLKESTELLSLKGVMIISFPNIRHLTALKSIFFKGTFPKADRGIFDRTHLRWFTLADGLAMCGDASLSVIKVTSHLRMFDAPGGRVNDWLQGSFRRFHSFSLIREFFSYQFILVAKRIGE